MSKGLIIAIFVGLAVVGGGAYLVVNNNSSDSNSESTQSSNTTAETPAEPAKQQASFSSLNKSGKAQKCDFEYNSEKGSGTGTIYTDGKGRGRMTAKYTTSKGEATSNTVVTADKAYGWLESGGKTTGFVYDKAKLENAMANSQGSTSGPSASQDFSVSCNDWTVDDALLTPPSNVRFQSLPGL